MVIGALILFGISCGTVNGWYDFQYQYMNSFSNYSVTNRTLESCGMPRSDSFHIFRDAVDGDIPWPGAVVGLSMGALFVWCQDQIIVQRCLAAKNISHVKAGTLLAGGLKLLSFLLFVIPGMMSRILYTEEVACANPEDCEKFCVNKAGCSNLAYPLLVLRLLPIGLRGLLLAALMAALMSSLTSIFNSASSIITLDLWKQFRKNAKEAELMIVGRVTVLILVVISVVWLPILQQSQGGRLWFYIQSVRANVIPPWGILTILSVFWTRTTEKGAFYGLMIGFVTGMIRMVLDFTYVAPFCGSGDEDQRPKILSKVDFTHFAIINAAISGIAMIVISLFTEPRPEKKLHRVTWWTRHDEKEPDFDSEDEEPVTESHHLELNILNKDFNSHDNDVQQDELNKSVDKDKEGDTKQKKVIRRNKKTMLRNWICGSLDDQDTKLSAAERARIHRQMTSIDERPILQKILSVSAVIMAVSTLILFVYFR
ncbi:hypothetical protein KUTeg_008812 [Tegillarca granosa]|uniref:Uncharacterized protein n=1 Tax=Tegillarca granosa TaxID=220873 RepID=A0ABQ9FCB4_TEGGR|nr:hypothetical protein KUTeg_008812 [Tegillarca granosa]